jgi:hypothetical protein
LPLGGEGRRGPREGPPPLGGPGHPPEGLEP